MKRHQVLIVAAISVLVLAGCTNAQQPTIQTSPAASPVATGQTDRAGVDRLLSVVSNTKVAVEAGNFSKANTEFSQFEDNWKQVEDGIKAKSSDRYKAIEDSLDRVTGELKGSQPNKQNVLADLQSMENNINSVAKL
ncbi:DUF4363 domain-containing protein [Chroococcidiopsis sp. CCALA 051]|uniref:DUF4363 domain-containing protein n=1 Tax=Chroococcidiopsis sp. CCALA 051 TaxID=869949 RepID=UPI000D0DCCEB|nr:DUF4363 domain-containing protein [Chroococcidiopsis sp. CCALA 051]PSM49610.1 DUF4363 domain-containing protein [Chroococcidiopsis sp. CCALA 051]